MIRGKWKRMKRKTGTEHRKLKAGTDGNPRHEWNGKRKQKSWKWSSELKIISGDSEHSSLGLWTSYV